MVKRKQQQEKQNEESKLNKVNSNGNEAEKETLMRSEDHIKKTDSVWKVTESFVVGAAYFYHIKCTPHVDETF